MFAAAALYVRTIFSSWTIHLTLYALAATMGLIGLLYFLSSGHAVLARMYSPEAAGLIIGCVFVVLALIMLAIVKIRAPRTSPATKGIASLALASTAGRLALRNSGAVGHVASRFARPALATAGAGLLLFGRLLGKPTAEPRGRDLAEDPLSLRESIGAFAAAAHRATRHAATEASQKWEELEPELRARATAVQTELPHLWARRRSLSNLLVPPPRRFWLRRKHESGLERVVQSLQKGETVGTVAAILAIGALAVWLYRNDNA